MAYRPPDSVIEHRLTRRFPAERLRELARKTGLVERRRKLDAAALFWALTLGFAMDEGRSIEALRQSYLRCIGGDLSVTYASFHGWFGASLTAFLREILTQAVEDATRSDDRLDGRLDRFRDVLIPDTTVVTLYRSLIGSFRARARTTLERNSTSSSRSRPGCRGSSRLPMRAPTRVRNSRPANSSREHSFCAIRAFSTTGRWT